MRLELQKITDIDTRKNSIKFLMEMHFLYFCKNK